MQEGTDSILTIERQHKISMTGVSSVDGFSETQILLTVAGKRVRIEGNKLKVLAFSEGSGNFAASGEVYLVKFGAQKGGTLKRLFK